MWARVDNGDSLQFKCLDNSQYRLKLSIKKWWVIYILEFTYIRLNADKRSFTSFTKFNYIGFFFVKKKSL
jgi:hypothetical protein